MILSSAHRAFLIAALIFVVFSGSTTSAMSQCVFGDTEFDQADWLHLVLVNTSSTATHTEHQELDDGNPGAFQWGMAEFPETSHFYTVHIPQQSTWEPELDGELLPLDCAFDIRVIDGSGPCGSDPGNPRVRVNMVLEQDGSYYEPYPSSTVVGQEEGWVSLSFPDLAAEDFGLISPIDASVDMETNPDFDLTGGAIRLGYAFHHSTSTNACIRIWGVDNYCAFLAATSVEGAPLVDQFQLALAPNPTAEGVSISFFLPAPDRVRLYILDVAGCRVKALVAGADRPAGPHRVVWNGRDGDGRPVPSGVYFCRVEAGDIADTRQLVLRR